MVSNFLQVFVHIQDGSQETAKN